MKRRFKEGDFVRVRGKSWVATVLEVAEVRGSYNYRVFPVAPRPLESSYWWSEWDLEPASILEAIAEAASDGDGVSEAG